MEEILGAPYRVCQWFVCSAVITGILVGHMVKTHRDEASFLIALKASAK